VGGRVREEEVESGGRRERWGGGRVEEALGRRERWGGVRVRKR
jgi:hypothetical protein